MSIIVRDKDGNRQKIAGVGMPGPAGKSAYQYAADGGFAGTEAEFSALLGQQSNTNLLDNGNFLDPINQRRKIEYTGHGYTIDRWYSEGLQVTIGTDGLTLERAGSAIAFIQRWEAERIKSLLGKTFTLSLLTTSGLSYCVFQITQHENGNYQSVAQNFAFSSDLENYLESCGPWLNYNNGEYQMVRIVPKLGQRITLIAAKLELGPVQTLAHKDANGNWVLNDPPPNKALEWLKCRRYFKSIGGPDTHFTGYRSYDNTKNIICNIPDVPMRTTPTVIANLNPDINAAAKDGALYLIDSADSFNNKIFFLHPTVEIPTRGAIALHINDDIWLSAEL